jgi:serine/threonine protein kinase
MNKTKYAINNTKKNNTLSNEYKKVMTLKSTGNKNNFKDIYTLSGGKFIDKGGFGCVISPAIPCSIKDKEKNLEKSVSKILREPTNEAYNEIKISNILLKLDPERKYYITFHKYCYINEIPENRKDIVAVHYINDSKKKFTIDTGQGQKDKRACDIELDMRPVNFIMPFAGYSLSSIMKTNPKAAGTRAIMHNLFITNLKLYFKHLILGIIKMHNNRIVNHDIKQKNIMLHWDKELNEMNVRYIDFGLSDFLSTEFCSHFSNISSKGTIYYTSPDLIVCYQIRKHYDRSEQVIIRSIMSEMLLIKKAFIRLNEMELLGNFTENIKFLFKKIKTLCDDKKILPIYFGSDKNKFNGFLQKGDIYALGLSIFETLYYYSDINVRDDKLLYDLLIHMITIDPDKRYNGVQCLAHPYFHQK